MKLQKGYQVAEYLVSSLDSRLENYRGHILTAGRKLTDIIICNCESEGIDQCLMGFKIHIETANEPIISQYGNLDLRKIKST